MTIKRNAPALRKRESVDCLPASYDIDVNSTAALRLQHLSRRGLSHARAAIVAPLLFGEARQ